MRTTVHLDAEARKEAQLVIKLQEWLMMLSESNITSIEIDICQSVFVTSEERIQQLVWNIIQAITVRPKSIFLYCNLISFLYSQQTEENYLGFLKPSLLKSLLTPKPYIDVFLSNVGDFIFLRHLIPALDYDISEIVEAIRDFCENHPDLMYYHCLLFCVFAPEIEEVDIDFFNDLWADLSEECTSPNCKSVLKDFYDNIGLLKSNGWKLLKDCFNACGCPNMISVAIRNDDIDTFQDFSVHPRFNNDRRIRPSVFEPCQFLQNEPTLIQYAAFHGSIKIFKFLLLNGADLELVDNSQNTLAHYVVAGGSTEIIRLCEQRKCDFGGSLQMATRFHRFDVFDWLHFTYFHDLSENNAHFGTVLHEAAGSDNIRLLLACLEAAVDVNIRAADNQTPVHFAVKNRMTDSVRVLLSLEATDVNAKDSCGMTPLHMAALFEDATMVSELLRCPRVDINATNSWGMTPLHIAAQDGNAETVEALMSRSELEVNAKDDNRMTPLHYAAQEGELETVRVLLTAPGIDAMAVDLKGYIPFTYAEQSGMDATAALLQAITEQSCL